MLKKDITEATVFDILIAITNGVSLRNKLRELGLEPFHFFDFLGDHPLIEQQYSRAQIARAEMNVEELIEIADTEMDAQKARNRIDARRWYATKMRPQKYGDRIDLNINNTTDVAGALSEARARLISGPILDLDSHVNPQPIDVTQSIQVETCGQKPQVSADPLKIETDDIFD